MRGVPQFMPIVSPVHSAAVEGGSAPALQPGAPAAAMPWRTAVPGLMKSSVPAPAAPAMEGAEDCEGVEDMSRCNRAPRLPPSNFPSAVFRC